MLRKRRILIIAVILVALAGTTAWLLIGSRNNSASLPNTNAQALTNDLNSPNLQTQSLALVPGLRNAYLQQGNSIVPKGTTLQFQSGTLHTSNDTGQVQVNLSDGTSYVAHIVSINGTWFVLYFEEK